MANKEPKVVWGEGTPWKSQSEFYTYIRGCLRRAWIRHPNKIKRINAVRFQVDRLDKDGKVMRDKKTGKPKKIWNCKCELCGHTGGMKDFQVDHIKPTCKGGTDELTNLTISCASCNKKKGRKELWNPTTAKK